MPLISWLCVVAVGVAGLPLSSIPTASRGPVIELASGRSLRILALELLGDGEPMRCHVELCAAAADSSPPLTLRHRDGDEWQLEDPAPGDHEALWQLGSPEFLFEHALPDAHTRGSCEAAAPFWPRELTSQLEARGVCGRGTVALDARWALAHISSAPMDHPMLLPNATAKLSLAGRRLGRRL